MKVFISWSKEPSKTVARTLNDWLPSVIQAVEPWMSEEDIKAGSRWHSEISKQLATTSFGIVCVTPQNQHEPWIQFEAGALAKTVELRMSKESVADESYVVPYLINMAKRELSGPLTAFQAIEASKEGTKKLVSDVNKALEAYSGKGLSEFALNKAFERAWPELEAAFATLPESTTKKAKREPEDILAEILDVVRDTNRKVGSADIDFLKLYSSLWNERNYRSHISSDFNPWVLKTPYVQTLTAPSERSLTLSGSEENLQKAYEDIKLDENLMEMSSIRKTPQQIDISIFARSGMVADNLLNDLKVIARKYELELVET